jgi:hypothetical protein
MGPGSTLRVVRDDSQRCSFNINIRPQPNRKHARVRAAGVNAAPTPAPAAGKVTVADVLQKDWVDLWYSPAASPRRK